MNKFTILGPALVAALVIMTGCSTTSSRFHPTLENERMTERESEIEVELLNIAKQKLLNGGYKIIDYDLRKAIAENEEFAYLVSQIKDGFEQAKKDLKHGQALSVEESKAVQASVGEAVNIISAQSGADAVLLISYQGFQKSEGQVAKDVGTSILVGVLTLGAVVPIQQTSSAIVEAALIDGVTGDVLWTDVRSGPLSATITDLAMESMPDDIDNIIETKDEAMLESTSGNKVEVSTN